MNLAMKSHHHYNTIFVMRPLLFQGDAHLSVCEATSGLAGDALQRKEPGCRHLACSCSCEQATFKIDYYQEHNSYTIYDLAFVVVLHGDG